jgi:ubiquitin-like protein Pup
MSPSGDQTRKPKPKQEEKEAEASTKSEAATDTSEIDDLLEEIDEVLETNSEDFVRQFIQKGGQ